MNKFFLSLFLFLFLFHVYQSIFSAFLLEKFTFKKTWLPFFVHPQVLCPGLQRFSKITHLQE